jgi:hypothetical protein
MAIPGFTAEACMYETSTPYRSAYGAFANKGSNVVVPQQIGTCESDYWACFIGCWAALGFICPFTGWLGQCRASYIRCLTS